MAIDYYEILQVSPSADLAEIKSAYRKLAQLHHPDKNPGSSYSSSYFELIKEAYETLSTPWKKEKYLQERWLIKINNQAFETAVKTPESILREILLAGEKINRMDIYRMNKKGIKEALSQLLSADNIHILNTSGETGINDAIINEFIQIIKVLPAADELQLLKKLSLLRNNLASFLKQREEALNNRLFWENWKPAFIILLVVLLCLLIWGTSLKN